MIIQESWFFPMCTFRRILTHAEMHATTTTMRIQNNFITPSPPQIPSHRTFIKPLASINLLFITIILSFWEYQIKGVIIKYVTFGDWLYHQHNAFDMHPNHRLYQEFLLFWQLHSIPQYGLFIHSPIEGHLGCFRLLDFCILGLFLRTSQQWYSRSCDTLQKSALDQRSALYRNTSIVHESLRILGRTYFSLACLLLASP